MTAELLQSLKEKSYDTCVSNLTKTHCVNLKKFNCDRLPDGTWITSKRFLSNTNRVVPNALFDLFGKFSSQTGSIVRDNMVGWAFDNFRLLEGVCKVAMEQRHTSLHVWINEMSNENKCGDEIALYILSQMYRKHTFVYTQMFWWTSLLYTLPVQERDLVNQCDIVLVYLKPGVFGELHKIRLPTATITSPHAMDTPEAPLSSSVIPQNAGPGMNKQDVEKDPTITPVITGSTVGAASVSTWSAVTATKNNPVDTALSASSSTSCHELQNKQPGLVLTKPPQPALQDINIFMTQRCSIPLIRCDYESALKATDTHQKGTESPKVSDTPSSLPALPEQVEENKPVHTSGRTHTVIDYKQFLEEYADAPPSPPKRRSEVDLKLKCRPLKQHIAAERYRSRFITKPTTVPRPVRNKRSRKKTDTTPELPLTSSSMQANPELEAPEIALTNKTLLNTCNFS